MDDGTLFTVGHRALSPGDRNTIRRLSVYHYLLRTECQEVIVGEELGQMPWRNQELQHQLVRHYLGINKVFGSDNELLFTGTAGSETMLGIDL